MHGHAGSRGAASAASAPHHVCLDHKRVQCVAATVLLLLLGLQGHLLPLRLGLLCWHLLLLLLRLLN
jgi:hypothetical protein